MGKKVEIDEGESDCSPSKIYFALDQFFLFSKSKSPLGVQIQKEVETDEGESDGLPSVIL